MLQIRLLGGPEIALDGHPIHLETIKTLALLAYLIVRPGAHQRDMLADLLWGDQGKSRAARSLRRALWNLRQTLCSGGEEASCPFLEITRRTVAFRRESPYTLDLNEFTRRLQAARHLLASKNEAASSQLLEHLQACHTLYRGEFLEGIQIDDAPAFESWLLGERAYYREQVLQALSLLSEQYIAQGAYDDAMLALRRFLALDPWSEWGYRQLMFCYALAGRRSEALALYDECRRALKEKLGVEPLPETRHLAEQLQDPVRYHALFHSRRVSGDENTARMPTPFVGRSREHAWLLDQWRRGDGTITAIEGEMGVGKTRLAEEALRHLAARGFTVLKGRSHQFGDTAPFQPLAEALRSALLSGAHKSLLASLEPVWIQELARLVPELRSQTPSTDDARALQEHSARFSLLEAMARLLEALPMPVVIFLDDLHWADKHTLDAVRYLAPRLASLPIWWLVAYRAEDIAAGSPLSLWLREFIRDGRLQTLHLAPISRHAARQYLEAFTGLQRDVQRRLADALFEESSGNAFMLVERIRDWVERGMLVERNGAWEMDSQLMAWAHAYERTGGETEDHDAAAPVPPRIRAMILIRVDRVSDPARNWLDLAAVMVGNFSPQLLARAAAAPEDEMMRAVDEWVRRGLVLVQPASRQLQYDFSHPLLRQVIYEALPPATRRHLHGRIARALEAEIGWQPPDAQTAKTLAYHYLQSGQPRMALRWLVEAGELMLARHAPEPAIRLFTQALRFAPADATAFRFRALKGRERAYHQLARREEQKADLAAMMALARQEGNPEWEAETLQRRAEWAMRVARFQQGLEDARRAYALARRQDAYGLMARALGVEAMCLLRTGEAEAAVQRCAQALPLSEQAGDPALRALILGIWGVAELDCWRIEFARERMEEALAYWRQVQNLWREAILCNNLSMAYRALGELDRALVLQQRARELVPQIRDVAFDAHSLTSLGLLYFDKRQYEEALNAFDQALALSSDIQDKAFEGYTRSCRGDALLAAGRLSEAQEEYIRGRTLVIEVGAISYLPAIQMGLARHALAVGKPHQALAYLTEFEDAFQQATIEEKAGALLIKACALARLGRSGEARQAWEAYLAQRTKIHFIDAWLPDMEQAVTAMLSLPASHRAA
ncbi:MAG: AAA family ATPase [Chloroflexi bacterium]|nr:AAA family ATPase [Chloroflexota bacterium]